MATSNGTGAPARLNSTQDRPRDGGAPADRPEPSPVAPERLGLALQAAYELEALMGAVLMLTAAGASENDLAIRGVAIRARDLAGAVMHALGDEEALEDVHRTVYGTHRSADGAAS